MNTAPKSFSWTPTVAKAEPKGPTPKKIKGKAKAKGKGKPNTAKPPSPKGPSPSGSTSTVDNGSGTLYVDREYERIKRLDLDGLYAELKALYVERKGTQQRMAVSRNRITGRNNSAMKRHERIDQEMNDATGIEAVYSTPTRINVDFRNTSRQVRVTDISMGFVAGEKLLLNGADLTLDPGHHYALIGRNGVGKSTFLSRIASGHLQNFPEHLKTLYIAQDLASDERTPLQTVLDANVERRLLKREEQILSLISERMPPPSEDSSDPIVQVFDGISEADVPMTAMDRLIQVYDQLDLIQADRDEPRALSTLISMGFTREMAVDNPTTALSGGWRMRVALAAAVFVRPDVLLLDEPTNHLDLSGILWLENFLSHTYYDLFGSTPAGPSSSSSSGSAPGDDISRNTIMIIVSHDKRFLDQVCTDTIVFKNRKFLYHTGNVSSYYRRKQEDQDKQEQLYDWQEKQRAHFQQTIAKAKTSMKSVTKDKAAINLGGLIKNRERALDRLGAQKTADGKRFKQQEHGVRESVTLEKPDKVIHFSFPKMFDPLPANIPIVDFTDVSFSYSPARPVFKNLSCCIRTGDKIGLLGPNGAGKSTLMGLFEGRLQPTSGEIQRHPRCKVGFFAQHHLEDMDPEITALQHMVNVANSDRVTELELRKQLGHFGITGSTALQKISSLSGGQKSRLAFAALTWHQPSLLLLDEPTNHLDFETIEALIEAIDLFPGAVILVSHNQQLLSQIKTQQLWLVDQKHQFTQYPASFEEYVADLRIRSI